MRFSLLTLAGAVGLAQATVPSDMASGFNKSMNLQVSFSQDVSSGMQDGQKYDQSQAMYQPNHYMKDSSSVKSDQKYVMVAVDTTDSQKRYMHYVHQDHQMSKDKKVMASQSPPAMGWWAPGYLGQSGKGRSYSFMMYKQPDNFQVKNLPKLGEQVDMSKFESDCGLQKAVTGISITVDIVTTSNDYKNYKSQNNDKGGYDSYWNYMPQKYNSYNMGYNQEGKYGSQYQQGWNQYQYKGYNQGSYSSMMSQASYSQQSTSTSTTSSQKQYYTSAGKTYSYSPPQQTSMMYQKPQYYTSAGKTYTSYQQPPPQQQYWTSAGKTYQPQYKMYTSEGKMYQQMQYKTYTTAGTTYTSPAWQQVSTVPAAAVYYSAAPAAFTGAPAPAEAVSVAPPFPTAAASGFESALPSGVAAASAGSLAANASAPSSSILVGSGVAFRERAWGAAAMGAGIAGAAAALL